MSNESVIYSIKSGSWQDPAIWYNPSPVSFCQNEGIRLTPTIVSVKSGRWYDPTTWDAGRCPNDQDRVELRHEVMVGKTAVVRFSKLWARCGYLKQKQTGEANPKYLYTYGTLILGITSPLIIIE